MARVHDTLDAKLIEWIGAQHVFFVASAPSGPDGHVNCSPKGYDTFRVLSPDSVAYLDLTGSGVETIAHLRDNGRITVMFCAFEGPPRILRLFGRGEAIRPGTAGFDELAREFPAIPGIRSIVRIAVERIQTSCGYAVPFLGYQGERETLVEWAERKGSDGIETYHRTENRESIDGLDGVIGPPSP